MLVISNEVRNLALRWRMRFLAGARNDSLRDFATALETSQNLQGKRISTGKDLKQIIPIPCRFEAFSFDTDLDALFLL